MRRAPVLCAAVIVLAACAGGDGRAPVTRGSGVAGDPGATSEAGIHTVERGETLSEIALSYGVDMKAVAALNDLSPPYTLRVGQRLRIPRPQRYTVQRGDTVYGIARRFDVPIRAVIEVNDLSPPYRLKVDQELRIPQPRTYTVDRGDTLYSISRRYDVAMSELARVNGLSEPYTITPGQKLLIPGGRTQLADAGTGGTAARTATGSSTAEPAGAESASRGDGGDGQADDGGEPSRRPVEVPRPEPKPAEIKRAAAESDGGDPDAGAGTSGGTRTAGRSEDVPDPPERESGRFAWPLRGEIVTGYGPQDNGLHNDGLNIAAERGTPVKAAANGVVAYVGNELDGFGNLVLVKHADNWITAYAHLQTILVERGAEVDRGEPIGRVGSSGGVPDPQLHFETRRGSDAVNPNEVLGPATAGRTGGDRRAQRGAGDAPGHKS